MELLRQLKRRRPQLPAILVSGFAGPELQAEAQAAGAQAVLTKPLSAVELAQCVAGVLAAARAAAVRADVA
jgi:CheY-like chemotaxis protein